MKNGIQLGAAVILLILLAPFAVAVSPTPDEMAETRRWAAAHLEEEKTLKPFFSFTYGGKPSAELLKTLELKRASRQLDDKRMEHTLTYTDPKTGLTIRCVGVEYRDFPTVEWTLYFKNTSAKDTPILADIQALDIPIERPAGASSDQAEFHLHHYAGSPCLPTDYQPFETLLTPGLEKRIATSGGRPTDSDLPYFNLQSPGGKGMIVVVGWAGQWAARFTRDKENHLQIRAGQELTHFKLLPGEEVRTPMIVLQFWKGDRIRSQNIWRRWMLAHNLPRPGGKPLAPFKSACNGNHYPGIITNAAEEMHFLRRYLEEGVKPDVWWQDAGWYPCDEPGNWTKTGTWEVETKRWPKGIREVSDWCRTQGIKTMVWFEPERVAAGTWLTNTHPEWVYGGNQGGLLKIGDPLCRAWLVDHIDKLLTEQGIDLYRQDYNISPLPFWRAADAQDRQGIAEIRHVEGYFAYWDELLRRRPGMLIDSCASGGRRNDIETLRRAVPLLRSDYTFEPVGQQNHTYGIAFWMPFYGTGFIAVDKYQIRSQMSPELTMAFDIRRKDIDYKLFRKLVGEWQQIAPCYLGDYYPLTPYDTTNDIWIAWQFDRPEQGDGVIQAFRRVESPYESIRVKLHGLNPNAVYTITNLDVAGTTEIAGRELLENGLSIILKEQPGAALIVYKKK